MRRGDSRRDAFFVSPCYARQYSTGGASVCRGMTVANSAQRSMSNPPLHRSGSSLSGYLLGERLLNEGLERWASGERREAIEAWREAAVSLPDDPRVVEYLEAVGAEPPVRPNADVIPLRPPSSWRDEVLALVKGRDYDAALAALYRVRATRPDDEEVRVSIQSLKEHVCTGLAASLGGLDGVPQRRLVSEARTPEALAVLRLVDDHQTFDDIASTSPLGRLRTLRVLLELFPAARVMCRPNRRRTLEFAAVSGPTEPPPTIPSIPATPSPPGVTARPVSSEFTRTFQEATAAYLARNFEEAERLFGRCVELEPNDRRARVSLERLQSRMKGR